MISMARRWEFIIFSLNGREKPTEALAEAEGEHWDLSWFIIYYTMRLKDHEKIIFSLHNLQKKKKKRVSIWKLMEGKTRERIFFIFHLPFCSISVLWCVSGKMGNSWITETKENTNWQIKCSWWWVKPCHNLSIEIRLAQWRVSPDSQMVLLLLIILPSIIKKEKTGGEFVLSSSSSPGPVSQGKNLQSSAKENSEEAQAEQFFGKCGLFPWKVFYKLHWPEFHSPYNLCDIRELLPSFPEVILPAIPFYTLSPDIF